MREQAQMSQTKSKILNTWQKLKYVSIYFCNDTYKFSVSTIWPSVLIILSWFFSFYPSIETRQNALWEGDGIQPRILCRGPVWLYLQMCVLVVLCARIIISYETNVVAICHLQQVVESFRQRASRMRGSATVRRSGDYPRPPPRDSDPSMWAVKCKVLPSRSHFEPAHHMNQMNIYI